ncbi:MAG: hypothetical protein ABIQ11_05360 [Saprospiraceae bacterium]
MTRLKKQTLFEHKDSPLISKAEFIKRQLRFMIYAILIISLSLGIGMVGYKSFTQLSWVESFQNAAMILSGMGPIDLMPNDLAKIFSGLYALFSGVIFVSTIAVMFAPIGHRLMHSMHLEENDDK